MTYPRKMFVLILVLHSEIIQALMPTRRVFLGGALTIPLATLTNAPIAEAGIDVSGLPVEGGNVGNAVLRNQLKAFDGSGSRRVQEIKAGSSGMSKSAPEKSLKDADVLANEDTSNAATFALRYADYTRLTKVGLGQKLRLGDYVLGPNNSKLSVSFEFPSDWLQLDRMQGGIQYVDQRNGDKLYLLKATLPDGTTLEAVPKSFFGQVIFDPKGSISRSGTTIDDYKVGESINLAQGRRRVILKYTTVTGNGLTVERRGLVDCHQVGQDVYMLMTSSNAVKFEKRGIERDTVEAICDSFRVDKV